MASVLFRHTLRTINTKTRKTNCLTILNNVELVGNENFITTRYLHRNYSKKVHSYVQDDSDSDSDAEERGTTNFWRRKMRTLHNHMDVNKDGVISYEDFTLLGDRFSNLGHLTPEAQREFKRLLNEMWEEQWGEISPYNHVCIEKYLEEMHHVLNDKTLKYKYDRFLPFLFKAVDKDHSGEISVEEFKLFFQCLGLSHKHAVNSFGHIDMNKDGKLSLHEFVSLGRDFFLSEDHRKPSKHFWGPLID